MFVEYLHASVVYVHGPFATQALIWRELIQYQCRVLINT